MPSNTWSEEETLMAFVLYLLLPKSACNTRTPEVQKLARAIGRTPDSVKMKMWNISSHDANRVAEGKVGLTRASKLDAAVWDRYAEEGDALVQRGLGLLEAALDGAYPDERHFLEVLRGLPDGKDRLIVATQRVNQRYFRKSLLDNYDYACCLTGLRVEDLLVASHIKPWSESAPGPERTTPSNGLLLNSFHDRAFDRGLITIDKDYRVVVSPRVPHGEAEDRMLWSLSGTQIRLPRRAAARPARQFIEYHNDVVFLR